MKPLDPRVLGHLVPARWPLAGVLVGGGLSGLLVVVQAFAVAALISGLVSGAVSTPAAVVLGGAALGRAVVGWVVDLCAARASSAVTTSLRRRLVVAALALGQLGPTRRRSGELALLSTRGVAAVDPYLTKYLPALALAATLPPLTVLAIAWQDLASAGIVLLTLPLVPVFAALVGMATRDRAERQWRVLAGLSGHFLDVMRGLPTLVVHRRAAAQAGSIRAITDRYRRATNQTLRLAFASSAVLELVATISVALVAVVVGLRLAAGSLDLRTALTVLLLAPEAYWPLRRVGAEFHAAAEGTATFEAADELLATAAAHQPVTEPAARPAAPLATGITLDGVTVGYPDRATPALAGFSADIPLRGLTAVTGPSGAGKSTLLAVLMGELPVSAGSVTVDGVDLAELDLDGWRSRIAWLPQRPWFLPGSVRDNVRLGRATATDAEVWAALERVGLADLVVTLPDGLDQTVGEDGLALSAGERARLALARVVVADRPVVLLDEPTAHLDAPTAAALLRDLRTALAGRVVVCVTHDEVEQPGDTVVRLRAEAPVPAGS
jgi:ATP-binding cassette subfamily C protein CydCD